MPTSTLTFPVDAIPPPGELLGVAPGVHWVRMPLPFALDHVNLWLLDDGDGWCLVDTGFCNDSVKAHWRTLFDWALAGRPIGRVVVTHFHPDHMGLAGWLIARYDAELLMARTEWLVARSLWLDDGADTAEAFARFYRRAGLPGGLVDALKHRNGIYRRSVSPVPPIFSRLQDGDTLTVGAREWRVIVGHGHAPEHLCLYCGELGLLISGDQVLPRISPNISVWPAEPDADPLDDFLASMPAFAPLPADTLVLPSHGPPFRGLGARLDQLGQHHRERLVETATACAGPATVMAVTGALFKRELDDHQFMFAVGETLAHLNHLVARGRITRSADADGILRFVAV